MYGTEYRKSFAPINVGDELDVTIESVGAKGDGVAKVKGFVLFVPGVQKGDNVKVRVTKVFRKMGFAEVVGQGQGEMPSGEEAESEESYVENESTEEAEMEVQDGRQLLASQRQVGPVPAPRKVLADQGA